MLINERQDKILKLLKEKENVSVKELSKKLFASEATIRRDLTELEKNSQVKRVYGGATLIIDPIMQVSFTTRMKENGNKKALIAEKAKDLIKDGQILFIDGSSTCEYLIPYLSKFKDIIVITNGLNISLKLAEMHIKTYSTGGLLIDDSYTFVGPSAEEFIRNHNIDICFLSSKGINNEGNITDTSERETSLRKTVLKNSKTKVLLITSNKEGKTYFHTLTNIKNIDYLISDIEIKK